MAKKEKKQRNKGDDANLEMTPMIDVVFQLLIFFIITLHQDDILSQLEALRPSPVPNSKPNPEQPSSFTIMGFDGRPGIGVYMYGNDQTRKSYNQTQIESIVRQLAKIDKNKTIIVNCTNNSPHGYLVTLLDMLNAAGLHSVSVFSLDNADE